MTLRKQPGRNVWIYQTRIGGKTWSRSTGQTDRKLAEKEVPRLQKLAQLLRGQPEGSRTFSQAATAMVAQVEDEVSKGRAIRVTYHLSRFLKYAGDLPLDRIDTELLTTYQRERLKVAALATVSDEISTLSRMLRLNGFYVPRPRTMRGRRTDQRALTPEELAKFFGACPTRLRLVYQMLLVTGARPAELIPSERSTHTALLKSELDFEKGQIKIRTAKLRGNQRTKIRVLSIPDQLVAPLTAHMQDIPGPHVFFPMPNAPRDFDSVLTRAGIAKVNELGEKLTAHSFRHTYATFAAEATGHNPFLLKSVLGHAQISTTERYCHPAAPVIQHSGIDAVLDTGTDGGGVTSGCPVVEMGNWKVS